MAEVGASTTLHFISAQGHQVPSPKCFICVFNDVPPIFLESPGAHFTCERMSRVGRINLIPDPRLPAASRELASTAPHQRPLRGNLYRKHDRLRCSRCAHRLPGRVVQPRASSSNNISRQLTDIDDAGTQSWACGPNERSGAGYGVNSDSKRHFSFHASPMVLFMEMLGRRKRPLVDDAHLLTMKTLWRPA